MKTFKQLREKWIQSVPSPYMPKEAHVIIDVFKNPSKKEVIECTKANYSEGNFRAFLMDNGEMYAWASGGMVHEDMHHEIKGINRKYIPIVGSIRGYGVMCRISGDIYHTIHKKIKREDAEEMVKEHKLLNRLFPEIQLQNQTGIFR